jgi:subtilisin family serine protease
MKKLWFLGILITLLALGCRPDFISRGNEVELRPSPSGTQAIPNSFVVQTSGINESAARALAQQYGLEFVQYLASIEAFLVQGNPNAVAKMVRENAASLEFAQQDYGVSLAATQTGAPFGLDRLDQRILPLDNTYNYQVSGTGVTIYSIDTGILATHSDFGGRAQTVSALEGTPLATDCDGHGTQVAALIGGATYGVAKTANLVGVRVTPACSGAPSYAQLVAGVDWVARNAKVPAVLNFGAVAVASKPGPLEKAVKKVLAKNIPVVAPAGNTAQDAAGFMPGGMPEVLSVGATDATDARTSFSNFGEDLLAPGAGLTSPTIGTNTATKDNLSGTSYASAYAAGVAAIYLQVNPTATPAQVAQALTGAATPIGGGRLLYSALIPPPPVFKANRISATSISLQWSLSGRTSYILSRGGVELTTLGTADYVDTDVTPATVYTYRLQARTFEQSLSAPAEITVATLQSTNLALGATSLVSSSSGNNPGALDPRWRKENAQDGQRDSATPNTTSFGWSSMSVAGSFPDPNPWYQLDFGEAKLFSRVDLYPRNDTDAGFGDNVGLGFPEDFVIQTSTDAITWNTVQTLSRYPKPSTVQRFYFDPQNARYVRVWATKLRDPFFQLAEIEVY